MYGSCEHKVAGHETSYCLAHKSRVELYFYEIKLEILAVVGLADGSINFCSFVL